MWAVGPFFISVGNGLNMRQVPQKLQNMIEPVLDTMGYELVGMEYVPGGKGTILRVYIDSDSGITLDDCERVSHQVSGLLDVEDPIHGHYALEISSPGLDRPLFTEEHFARFQGYPVKFRLHEPLDGRRKFKGIIQAVDGENILMDVEGEVLTLTLDMIEKANLIAQI
jgi:ribosome maturation factor RimP